MDALKQLENAARELSRAVDALRFSAPVTHVYNPLDYAWESHAAYLRLALKGGAKKKMVFLGMNPGPFGMAQTGVPFGEIAAVRDWMGIYSLVGHPASEAPRRPVEGFACERSEVSGQRLWGLFAETFGSAENFFRHHFVANYCPLLFLDSGETHCRNLTPDKFPAAETEALYAACDAHLRAVVEIMQPDWVIGVGKFAEDRASVALTGLSTKEVAKAEAKSAKRGESFSLPSLLRPSSSQPLPQIGTILHPSPASPVANRGWSPQASAKLRQLDPSWSCA